MIFSIISSLVPFFNVSSKFPDAEKPGFSGLKRPPHHGVILISTVRQSCQALAVPMLPYALGEDMSRGVVNCPETAVSNGHPHPPQKMVTVDRRWLQTNKGSMILGKNFLWIS